MNLLDISVSED